ncbi:hypothetical protein J6TS1_03960 [Siminovitchia terrae]|uniref:Uncharacterized protein n=1 Tax=Siminovitchia terrae TaxID=1914933 RepID=A0ABQ4KSE8_SIMTE|nr:hypothetical protein [Siminovitchia terrae]GIN94526.1 hypothetical protein J6TS1_03960 [Siminovitchia terrae]
MNAYWYSIQQGFKPRLNKVKASGGCHRFYRAELDKIWAQIRQGTFDGAYDFVVEWTLTHFVYENGIMGINL